MHHVGKNMIGETHSLTASADGSPAKRKLPLYKKTAYAAIATIFFFVILELSLRLIGYRFLPRTPEVIVNGKAVAPMFRHSTSIRWEPIPGAPPFNEDGFVGPKIPLQRIAGTLRVATLGDSCTQFGEPPYAEILREILAVRIDQPVEVLNAGVGGYSTEQGLPRLTQKVLCYRPDVVTIYFGWNDHWVIEKVTDAERAREDARSWNWLDYVGWSRVVQVGLFGAHTIHERRVWRLARQPYVPRVPLDRFRENLEQIVRNVRSISAEPILVTAPTDMNRDTPFEEFDSLKSLASTEFTSPRQLHDAFLEATRQVARETRTRLVDAAAAFERNPGLITRDHIHLTDSGIQLVAHLLADEVMAHESKSAKTNPVAP